MAWQEVYSSSVDAWDYDPASQTMLVRWKGGKTSAYEGVPPGLAEKTMKSYSVGTALRNNVIGRYKHRYLDV